MSGEPTPSAADVDPQPAPHVVPPASAESSAETDQATDTATSAPRPWAPTPLSWKRLILSVVLLGAVAIGAEVGMPALIEDSSIRQLVMLGAVNVLIALSLNIINGMAGQFSIGHAGFVGVGAYSAAVVAANLHEAFPGDITFVRSLFIVPPSVAFGASMAGFFGLLVGLPSLRLRGDYLAIVTLGFAEIFRLLIATASAGSQQGGLSGALAKLGGQNGYAGPRDLGVPQYAGPFWVFTAVFVMVALSLRLKFSGWGRALRALREDEIAAAAVGVDPTRYKVTSFVLAASSAGAAGALLATMRDGSPTTQPDQFGFAASFDAITMVILGGSGSISGAILGGLFITFTIKAIELVQATDAVQAFRTQHEWLDLNALRMVIYAAVLIAVMLLRPEGVFGEREIKLFRPKRDA
jgi:branched-chain amino acid transport system permease protein